MAPGFIGSSPSPGPKASTTDSPLFTTPGTPSVLPARPRKRKNSSPGAETPDPFTPIKGVKKTKAPLESPKPVKKRKVNGTPKAGRPIPLRREDCDHDDVALIEAVAKGVSWPEINKQYAETTGERLGDSTLPNRHARMMLNFAAIPDKDKANLIVAKQTIEKEFEDQKWEAIAARMQDLGTKKKYDKGEVERQHKKMMLDAEDLPDLAQPLRKARKIAKAAAAKEDEEDEDSS